MKTCIYRKYSFPLCGGLLFSSYLILIFCTFKDYGITWDEYIGHTYGQYILNYYLTFFQDKSATTFLNVYLYGGFFEILSVLFSKVMSFAGVEVYESRHLLNAITGFIGVCYAFLLGMRIAKSKYVGILSALFLFFMPRYFGHSFNNPKDIPFAVLYLATLYYICDSVPYWGKKLPGSSIAKIGIASGLCIGTRVGGGILLVYFFLFFAGYHLIAWGRKQIDFKTVFLLIARNFFPIAAISYATMLVFWPWAQQNPLVNPWISSRSMLNFVTFSFTVLFEGNIITSAQTPPHYLLKWIGIATPFVVLLGLLFFLAYPVCIRWLTKSKKTESQETTMLYLLVVALGFPIFTAIFLHTKFYNGMRHFLFLLPLIAILSALGYNNLHGLALKFARNKIERFTLNVFSVLFIALQLGSVMDWYLRSHPHQFLFFNVFAGEIQGAYRKYDMEYWGSSHKQAAEWLNAYIAQKHDYRPPERKYIVRSCEHPLSVLYYLDPKYFEYSPDWIHPWTWNEKITARWDFFVVSRESYIADGNFKTMEPGMTGKELHRICIDGVPVAVIYQFVKREDR